MGEWSEWIGRTQEQEDTLTPALLKRFRATTDSDVTGDVAPQAIHWCLCLPEAATADLDGDGHPKRGGFLPPVPLPRRMWASSKVEFHAPIVAGAAITRRSTITDVSEKQGSSGPLIFVQLDHQTSANSIVAVYEQQTLVYREGGTSAPNPKPADITPDFADWDWHRSLIPCETLLFRFSALTFNSHRIHYDRPYAETEERYRDLVVHGPLTATLLIDLAARELGPNRLKSFSFRGESPAFAGETLHLVGRKQGEMITLAALGGDGRTVMSAQAA